MSTTDPSSIPDHVYEAHGQALSAHMDDHPAPYAERAGIAAALDALMDDQPVAVNCDTHDVKVRPDFVLAAALARSAS